MCLCLTVNIHHTESFFIELNKLEKNVHPITFPRESKLYYKIINVPNRIVIMGKMTTLINDQESIPLGQSGHKWAMLKRGNSDR